MLQKILLTYLLLFSITVRAQVKEFDIRERSMYLPAPQKAWKFDHSLSLAQIYLPKDWLEQSVSGPMFEYKANFALPKGFALNGNFNTLFVANETRLGASWNHSFNNRLHLGVGYQVAFDFGILREFGYNNTIQVWQHHPTVRLGYNRKDIAFTVQGKLDFISSAKLSLADYVSNNLTGSMLNGYSAGIFIEQRLTRRNSICFGFIANFDKFNILGWPALNTVSHKYFIPEINIGFKL